MPTRVKESGALDPSTRRERVLESRKRVKESLINTIRGPDKGAASRQNHAVPQYAPGARGNPGKPAYSSWQYGVSKNELNNQWLAYRIQNIKSTLDAAKWRQDYSKHEQNKSRYLLNKKKKRDGTVETMRRQSDFTQKHRTWPDRTTQSEPPIRRAKEPSTMVALVEKMDSGSSVREARQELERMRLAKLEAEMQRNHKPNNQLPPIQKETTASPRPITASPRPITATLVPAIEQVDSASPTPVTSDTNIPTVVDSKETIADEVVDERSSSESEDGILDVIADKLGFGSDSSEEESAYEDEAELKVEAVVETEDTTVAIEDDSDDDSYTSGSSESDETESEAEGAASKEAPASKIKMTKLDTYASDFDDEDYEPKLKTEASSVDSFFEVAEPRMRKAGLL